MHSRHALKTDKAHDRMAGQKRRPIRRRRGFSASGSTSLTLPSRAATEALGRSIGRCVKGGDVLALVGELGAGKTSLVRGIAAGLEASAASVSSPTFVLIHEYPGRLPLIHIDLYRLRNEAEAEAIGLQEYFNGQSVAAVEWADRFPALMPEDRLDVRLMHKSPTARAAELSARGPASLALLDRIAGDRQSRRAALGQAARPGRRRKAPR
jgi:tRNA threonylcarbamoyladenosine biosynthesis protein TsaE